MSEPGDGRSSVLRSGPKGSGVLDGGVTPIA